MASARIQTDLLGQQVIILTREELGSATNMHFRYELAGKTAEIRSVYLDKDGHPKYTLSVGGELWDTYQHFFKLPSTQPS